jgi:hypothetical protein
MCSYSSPREIKQYISALPPYFAIQPVQNSSTMTEQISLVDVSSSVSLKGEDSSNVALLRGLFINDVAASDPADSSADVRKDELSSDDSDNDDEAVPNQNDFSQRRRVQNAQFEALSATPRRRYLVRLLLT